MEKLPRLGRVSQQPMGFSTAHEALVLPEMSFPVEPDRMKSLLDDVLHAVEHAGRKHEVLRGIVLKGEPHASDVVAGVAPIPLGVRSPRTSSFSIPIFMAAAARQIFRETKFSPRLGDS